MSSVKNRNNELKLRTDICSKTITEKNVKAFPHSLRKELTRTHHNHIWIMPHFVRQWILRISSTNYKHQLEGHSGSSGIVLLVTLINVMTLLTGIQHEKTESSSSLT